MSIVEGLFAAGDCADQMKVVHMAIAGGYAAGKHAVDYAKRRPAERIPEQDIHAERARLMEPLERPGGLHYRELEDVLRRIMKEYVGPARTEVGLCTAARKIARLKNDLSRLGARNPHELMRCLETEHLVTVGEVMSHAALARKESRFIPYHYRLDYPETDDRNWGGQIVVHRQNGELRTEFVPMDGGGN